MAKETRAEHLPCWDEGSVRHHKRLLHLQRISLTGQLRRAVPKTIRYRLLHVAATITPAGRHLRLDHNWPWTNVLLDAIHQLRHQFHALTVTTAEPAHAAP